MMWTNGNQIYRSDAAVADAYPAVSLPIVIDADTAEYLGLSPVVEVNPPAFDPDLERLAELPPTEIAGVWTQQWQVISLTEEQKAERLLAMRQQMVATPFQAKAALLLQGLLDDVEALVSDPGTDPLVKLAWSTALEFRRTSPSVLGIAQALGWTDEQLDELFMLASTIEV